MILRSRPSDCLISWYARWSAVFERVALNRDQGRTRRSLDQLEIAGIWTARLRVVHGERAEHLIVFRKKRLRPSRAETMAQRPLQAAPGGVGAPQSITGNVRIHHGLFPKRRRTTRTHARSDSQWADCVSPSLGNPASGGRP